MASAARHLSVTAGYAPPQPLIIITLITLITLITRMGMCRACIQKIYIFAGLLLACRLPRSQ